MPHPVALAALAFIAASPAPSASPRSTAPPQKTQAQTASKCYAPIALEWQTITLTSPEFDKLVRRCNGDPDTLAVQVLKSKARDIASETITSYDTGTARMSQTSDIPYTACNGATGKPETDYISVGRSVTIETNMIASGLTSALITCQDSEIASPPNASGAPPTVQTNTISNFHTLAVNHPTLVNALSQVNEIQGKVRLYVITARFIPQDLVPSL